MTHQLPADYETAPIYYLPIRAPIIPYIAGAIQTYLDESLWLSDADYESAYRAIAELDIAMTTLENANANEVLAGPESGATAPAALRRLIVADLPAIAYSALTGIPATFPPTAHASTHGAASGDPVTPAAIGAATTAHAHDYSTLVNRPATFAPSAHAATHASGDDLLTPAAIGAAPVVHGHTIAYSALTGIPATFAPNIHASRHAWNGADPVTPAAIGASVSTHTHTIYWTDILSRPKIFYPLGEPLVYADWNGVAKGVANYVVNVNSMYGVPSGAYAVAVRALASWASLTGVVAIRAYGYSGGSVVLRPQVVNVRIEGNGIVALNSNSFEVQILTAATTYTFISIIGYWL